MKCHKCKNENLLKANFCQKCGEKFTEKEKEEAYNKTIFGKIDFLKKIKDIVTLDVITSNIIFKIVSLLVVLGIGLYFLFTVGINTKILNSQDYQVFYNKENSEYYLLIDDNKDSIELNLYRPNRIKEMTIYTYDLNGNEKAKTTVSKDDKITLNTYQDDYHTIESNYSNEEQDNLKIYVYHKSDITKNK